MDKYRKLADLMRAQYEQYQVLPVISAEVKSIEGESCTVDINGLEIDEVRLKATINGASNKILAMPKVGSYVLLGSLTGDLKDLCVLKVDEVAQLQYEQDGLKISVDSEDGRVSISNASTSLKDLLQQLTDLLKKFKVYTPSGPSGTALPDTLLSIEQFEMNFKMLLK